MRRRPRRNRKNKFTRELIRETQIEVSDLIYPMFLIDGEGQREEIGSMPGQFRLSIDQACEEIGSCLNLGLNTFALFPALQDNLKNRLATESLNPEGLYLRGIREIKKSFPDAILLTDVAMDPYSSDGHDGVVEGDKILNDPTLEILGQMAVAQASAGADIIGPSDMMDGRVGVIRDALDENDHQEVSIMSYAVKYASHFYGPFREALDSAPKSGDKKTYQMDYRNRSEALIEAELDYNEGADFLMVKPALSYLDIISDLKSEFPLPIAAYNVSGEYAMIKAAAKNGWINGEEVALEVLTSIKRAGADIILTYFAKEIAKQLKT